MEGIRNVNVNKCLLVTEANEIVATGHLMETIELEKLLDNEGIRTVTMLNDDAPQDLKIRLKNEVCDYEGDVSKSLKLICDKINDYKPHVVVTDLREVSDKWIIDVKKRTGCKMICIDEFGNRRLSSDVIINPMIDSRYWNYNDSEAQVFSGNNYLVLNERIVEYHNKEKLIKKDVDVVCISMGGVDYYGTTNKIVKELALQNKKIKWNVVIGAGYKYERELRKVVSAASNIEVFQNVKNIYDLFYDADIAFCAGGNTLHELACIGVPAIVIPTVEHEYHNGKRFEQMGFGKCLNMTQNINMEDAKKVFLSMFDINARTAYSRCGKEICDGKGGERNVSIIRTLLDFE